MNYFLSFLTCARISTAIFWIAGITLYGQPTFEETDRLFQKVVDAYGSVDYRYLKKNPVLLKNAIDELKNLQPSKTWKSEDQLAYWINVYNIFTIDLIVQNYPLKSIQDLDGGKPWDIKRIALHGKVYSLNEIENEIIRPQFKDARIHFALNCAARSCPPLHNKAYTGAQINTQLDQKARAFLQDSKHTIVKSDTLFISKIFDWYKEDFGDILKFINQYRKSPLKPNTKISYQEYDWSINDR
jgi:hypothetical protein